MKRTLIGDVHGKYEPYKKIIKANPDSIQLGDMGVGFTNIHGDYLANPSYDTMVVANAQFIRGNHDNPTVCRNHTQCIDDGFCEITDRNNKVMYLGGAWSIDYRFRTMGFDIWRDEELSMEELQVLIDKYIAFKPDVMLTHDTAESIAATMFINGTHKPLYQSRTGTALDFMWQQHKPKLWVFGHWHESKKIVIDNCQCICLNELETLEVDF